MKSYTSYLQETGYVVFLLHGVVHNQHHQVRNYSRKHLVLDEFAQFLDDLMSVGSPVSMDQIVAAHEHGCSLPPHSFAVTFDDGFENNYKVAAPVLDDLNIPATFYVTTGFVGSSLRSWTDMIEDALEQQSGKVVLRGLAQVLDGIYKGDSEKIALMDAIRIYVKGNQQIDPYEFAETAIQQIGKTEPCFDAELDGKMGWEQVGELAQHPLFQIGGHSHTHRILSFLERDDLESEISTSLRLLESATGCKVRHYSYPEGLAHCYSNSVIEVLRQHGVICCPTAENGWNQVEDDLFRLKRIFVI